MHKTVPFLCCFSPQMGDYQSAGGEGSRKMFPTKLEEVSGHVIHRLGQDISLLPRGPLSSLSRYGTGTGFKSRNIKLDSRFGSGLPLSLHDKTV